MPLAYVPPEMAFTVSVGGSDAPVYHVYKNGNISNRMTYWYTLDEAEGEDNEFDIRDLPTWSCLGESGRSQVMGSLSERARFHESFLQEALDRGLVRINNNQLITVGGA